MEDGEAHSSLIFMALGVAILYSLLTRSERVNPNLKHIASSGHGGYLLSYVDAFGALFHGVDMLQRGYEQHTGSLFRFATLYRWLIVVAGTKHIEEMRKAPEDVMSFVHAISESDVSRYTLGHLKAPNIQQANLLIRYITQNLTFLTPDIKDELMKTLADASFLPLTSQVDAGWKEVCGRELIAPLTARTVDRVFFGLTFARDDKFNQLSARALINGLEPGTTITHNIFPYPLKNFVSWFISSKRLQRHIRKVMSTSAYASKDKQNGAKKEPDYDIGQCNDVLFQVLHNKLAGGLSADNESIILDLNTSVKQIIAMVFGHALYDLASHPTDAIILRQEIINMSSRHGWNRNAVDRMIAVDSFLKESMRLNALFTFSSIRKTLQPFTFSDGTHIPPNTFLAVPNNSRHHDDAFYSPGAKTFNGFRFVSSLRWGCYPQALTATPISADGVGDVHSNLTTSSTSFLSWGSGQHACPGRFFAAALLKLMLAHIVLHYEVKFEDGKRPPNVVVDMNHLPDLRAKILIKKRS